MEVSRFAFRFPPHILISCSNHHHGINHVRAFREIYVVQSYKVPSSVGDIVSLEDRGRYQGIIEAMIAVSNGLGPVLGGLFSEKTTW